MLRNAILPLIFVGLLGCQSAVDAPAQGSEPAKDEATTEQAVHAAHAQADEKAGEGCGDESETTKLENDTVEARTAEDGTSYTHVGGELTGAPEVAVAELMANPDKWAGKRVTISGNVSAMCQHKRGWFAVVGEGDQSGQQLQVKTAPVFLVPAGSIGKSAKAEGTVEVIEVKAEHARHLAAEHKIGEPEEITAPVKRVVVQAVGADFI